MARTPLCDKLPDFPWDSLAGAKAQAAAHPEGIIDLSVGNPIDPVSPGVQLALANAAGLSGYPQTAGTAELRAAIISALERCYGITGLGRDAVLPVVGTKEAIASLPSLLGMAGETVVIPTLAYPTYEVGAIMAGATVLSADTPPDFGAAALVFINSPSNPSGAVLGVDELSAIVEWARANDAIVASDECYLGLGYNDDDQPVSILDPRVCGGNHDNLLAIHSLSKTANLASYRAGFFAGDPAVVGELLEVRKHAGLIVPGPVQAAMVAALEDDDSETFQRQRYASRRAVLMRALVDAGFRIEQSDAGMYLWATRGEDCRVTVDWLAARGILVAPGDFYGDGGAQFVRVGLNATDEQVTAAAARLSA